jgi:hypothetical protein
VRYEPLPLRQNRPRFTRIIYFNHVMELMTGIPVSSALGCAPADIFGYFRNEHVQKAHEMYLNNLPDPQYVAIRLTHEMYF